MSNVKRITLSAAFVSCALFTSVGHTSSLLERMKVGIENQYKNGALEPVANCLGVTEEKFLEGALANLANCEDSIEEMESCSTNKAKIAKHIGVSKEELIECGKPEAQTKKISTRNNPTEEKLDALYDKIGDREPTSSEREQIKALTREMMAASQEQIKSHAKRFADSLKAASKNTENLVTLPIYSNSTILSHGTEVTLDMTSEAEAGNDFLNGVDLLPSAVFESSGNLQEVVNFYKDKLPGFEGKSLDKDSYIFMKDLPENFSITKNIKETMSVPNILVRKTSQTAALFEETKTIINITYKPK
jgi:hypothetical protein